MLTALVVTSSIMLGLMIINWRIALIGILVFSIVYYVVGIISRENSI